MSDRSDTGTLQDELGNWLDALLFTGVGLILIDNALETLVALTIESFVIAIGIGMIWTWGVMVQPVRRGTNLATDRLIKRGSA